MFYLQRKHLAYFSVYGGDNPSGGKFMLLSQYLPREHGICTKFSVIITGLGADNETQNSLKTTLVFFEGFMEVNMNFALP
jgi:hypothetical protein